MWQDEVKVYAAERPCPLAEVEMAGGDGLCQQGAPTHYLFYHRWLPCTPIFSTYALCLVFYFYS